MVPRSRSSFATVSFISDDPDVTEAAFVSLAEQAYRINSHRVSISAEDMRRDFKALVRTQDAPFGSLSIYAQYAVFREAAAQSMTVMLDGQGSDELLGGYNTAVSAAIAERIAHGKLLSALSIARAFNPIGRSAYNRTILSALGRFIPPAIAPLFMRLVNEPLCPAWLDEKWFVDRDVSIEVRPQGRGRDALDEELRLFTEDLSLPQLLRFEDRNSMAFGIESRVPFCDSEFAAVVASIPTTQLITPDGQTKAPLRTAFRGLVPDEIIDRRKVGFNAPDEAWLFALKPWIVRELEEHAWRVPFLRMESVHAAMSGSSGHASDIRQFWRVVSTVLWASTFDVQAV
jgi:asparagine synthase (glutamine-hydrolysing)